MPNVFTNVQVLADRAAARLYNEAVFANTLHRDYEANFTGSANGGSVLIRRPATFEAKVFDRATGTVPQNINEGQIKVDLGPILDVTVEVNDEDLDLSVDDFDERILQGMMLAIVQGVDKIGAGLVADLAQTLTGDVTDPKILAKASGILGTKNAPRSDRYAIVDPTLQAEWSTKPPFDKADTSASTDGLREAKIGKAYTFETFESNADMGDVGGVAFHRDAMTLVTRTLSVPKGAIGAVANINGFGVRVIFDHSSKFKQQTVSVDLMVGGKVINPDLAVVLPASA